MVQLHPVVINLLNKDQGCAILQRAQHGSAKVRRSVQRCGRVGSIHRVYHHHRQGGEARRDRVTGGAIGQEHFNPLTVWRTHPVKHGLLRERGHQVGPDERLFEHAQFGRAPQRHDSSLRILRERGPCRRNRPPLAGSGIDICPLAISRQQSAHRAIRQRVQVLAGNIGLAVQRRRAGTPGSDVNFGRQQRQVQHTEAIQRRVALAVRSRNFQPVPRRIGGQDFYFTEGRKLRHDLRTCVRLSVDRHSGGGHGFQFRAPLRSSDTHARHRQYKYDQHYQNTVFHDQSPILYCFLYTRLPNGDRLPIYVIYYTPNFSSLQANLRTINKLLYMVEHGIVLADHLLACFTLYPGNEITIQTTLSGRAKPDDQNGRS